MPEMKILVTGGTGFVGTALLSELENYSDIEVVTFGRRRPPSILAENFYEGEIGSEGNYAAALTGVDVVIHCAARAHVMQENESEPLAAYRKVNTDGTLALAEQAAISGVTRLVFLSSIKVNGERTVNGKPFQVEDSVSPKDAYGVSKHEAEIALQKLAQKTGMEVVIIRLPLVYGEGVKGNFSALIKLAKLPIPLPLGNLKSNLRSLVYVGNLVDFAIMCSKHPKAANGIFFVSDNEDLSTTKIITLLRELLGMKGMLIPIPTFLFQLLGRLTGKSDVVERLCGSLQVDVSTSINTLGWKPKYSVLEGFEKTVKGND